VRQRERAIGLVGDQLRVQSLDLLFDERQSSLRLPQIDGIL
jgi:hypothetical protein